MKLKDMSIRNMRSLIDLGFVHMGELEDLINVIENNTLFEDDNNVLWNEFKRLFDKELLEMDVEVKIEAKFTNIIKKKEFMNVRYMFCDKRGYREEGDIE